MVATCKKYILNASNINRTVKEGLNPSRYEDIIQIIGNYFASDSYNNLTQTVKTLHTDLQESQTPHSLLRDVSIQLAVATVMFNGQRPEVATYPMMTFLANKITQLYPTTASFLLMSKFLYLSKHIKLITLLQLGVINLSIAKLVTPT